MKHQQKRNLIWENVKIINSIEDDILNVDGVEFYFPAWVNGVYDPEKADKTLRKAQGVIFSTMRELGLPLDGWGEFDGFIFFLRHNFNFKEAWRCRHAYSELDFLHEHNTHGEIRSVRWESPIGSGSGRYVFTH